MSPELESRVLLAISRAGADGLSWQHLFDELGIDDESQGAAVEAVRTHLRVGRVVERDDRLSTIDHTGLVAGCYEQPARDSEVRVQWPRSQRGRRLQVSWRHRKGARPGDHVLARPLRSRGRRGGPSSASVLAILERSGEELIGRLRLVEGRFRLEPFLDDDRPALEGLDLVGDTRSWRDDEWVLARIVRSSSWSPDGPAHTRKPQDVVHVASSLGFLGEPGVDAQIVAIANGIPLTFPNAVVDEVRTIAGPGPATSTRRDLTGLPTVTIDGETARDFDDAITVEPLPGGGQTGSGFRLYVHIADVSHFVEPGSGLDREAFRRGTSVYLQETVVPMLPSRLSDDLCSLRPQEDRFAVSVCMDFDETGRRIRTECCESLIRSDGRLTYDQVADFLDGRAQVSAALAGSGGAQVQEMLDRAGALMRLLNARRTEEGSLEFDLPTSTLRFDARGRVAGANSVRLASHRLIEEFMLEANTAVAELLDEAQAREIAGDDDSEGSTEDASVFLYRVHTGLSRDGMAEIEKVFPIEKDTRDPGERIGRVAELTRSLDGGELLLLAQLTLRALERATYEPVLGPHRALGKSHYCHFTSPIRRYPDLLMHRRLKEVLGITPRTRDVLGPAGEELDAKQIARDCSRTERRAEQAERELRRWRVLRHLEDRLGSVHRGLITGVGKPGLFVQLTRLGADGLVGLDSLVDDHYLFDDDGVSLVGRRTGRRFRMGDELRVRVAEVDLERRWLQLTIVGLDNRLFSKSG